MTTFVDGILDRYALASAEFERRLRLVRPGQWDARTPCAEWTVRDLVNHMARGNLNYVDLLAGGTSARFLANRDADALGDDPLADYRRSVRECADAFARPGAMSMVLDYPLGRLTAARALAVRTTDATVHTWDLARAIDADDVIDAGLIEWVDEHLPEIYAGLAESPVAERTSHRFFAAPAGEPPSTATCQDRLLHVMGRDPKWIRACGRRALDG